MLVLKKHLTSSTRDKLLVPRCLVAQFKTMGIRERTISKYNRLLKADLQVNLSQLFPKHKFKLLCHLAKKLKNGEEYKNSICKELELSLLKTMQFNSFSQLKDSKIKTIEGNSKI